VDENIFDTNSINGFLKLGKTDFENKLKKLMPGLEISADIKKDIFEKSLVWDQDISKMDANKPIKTSLFAHSSYPVGVDFSILGPKFDIPTKIFNFSGIKNEDVTYKIVFPQGISIDVSDTANKSVKKELNDGRQYFEISFDAAESDLSVDVSCKMMPSIFFIIGIFIPCIITAIIVIILIFVIYAIRKKRKGKTYRRSPPKQDVEEEEIITGYDGEEYYVPPPPKSKK